MYKVLSDFLTQFIPQSFIFKYGFNLSPMYSRSTGKIVFVSEDMHEVKVKIPLTWKNKNYAGSIFGGSLFSATDPILMIQFIRILGNDYVVWDRSSEIIFKRPGTQTLFVDFIITQETIDTVKATIAKDNEMNYTTTIYLKDADGNVYTEIKKVVYIASKNYFKEKRKSKK